jgi:hypothetical protein
MTTGGKALISAYRSLTVTPSTEVTVENPSPAITYKDVTKALTAHFSPKISKWGAIYDFRCTKQNHGDQFCRDP